jgi:hypothetical protein
VVDLFQSPNNTEIIRALPRAKINIASSFTSTIRNQWHWAYHFQAFWCRHSSPKQYGTLVESGPGLLSATIIRVMILAGILCVIGTLMSIYRSSSNSKNEGIAVSGPRRLQRRCGRYVSRSAWWGSMGWNSSTTTPRELYEHRCQRHKCPGNKHRGRRQRSDCLEYGNITVTDY